MPTIRTLLHPQLPPSQLTISYNSSYSIFYLLLWFPLYPTTDTTTHTTINNQTGEGIEENYQRSKNGNRNLKEITKGDIPGDKKTQERLGLTDASITNRIQEVEERISL